MTFQLEIRTAEALAAETRAAFRARLVALVDEHIEARARALGYNSALSCISYRLSGVPAWIAEAEAFAAWRDAVWQALIRMEPGLGEGEAMPGPEDLLAALPAWPG